jgi:hypothetical protein
MATETRSAENILFAIKKQAAAGVAETLAVPDDVVLVTGADVDPSAEFDENEEKVGSIDTALPELSRIRPTISNLSHLFRGSGDITAESMFEKLITCGGWERIDQSAATLPAAGTGTADASAPATRTPSTTRAGCRRDRLSTCGISAAARWRDSPRQRSISSGP